MDWQGEEGRKLLRQAYPDGYLAMCGVRTIGNLLCVNDLCAGGHIAWRFACGAELRYFPSQGWIRSKSKLLPSDDFLSDGDLLPLPGPADHATWACLLADLARAKMPGLPEPPWNSVSWYPSPKGWAISVQLVKRHKSKFGPWSSRASADWRRYFNVNGTDIPDPAEALVLARAQLREVK